MVIGLFAKPSDAEGCLTNVTEADFKPKDISVIAQEKDILDALGEFSGSLSGSTFDELPEKFASLGLSKQQYTVYLEKINKGYILIGISTRDDTTILAKEMLQDAHAENIQSFPASDIL